MIWCGMIEVEDGRGGTRPSNDGYGNGGSASTPTQKDERATPGGSASTPTEKDERATPGGSASTPTETPIGLWSGISIKHSLGNALRIVRPIVIIDEGRKAYSDTARDTLNGFTPSFIMELSATPNTGKKRVSNILVDVPGTALKDEEMIKLPINIFNYDTEYKRQLFDVLTECYDNVVDAGELELDLGENKMFSRC